MTKHAATAAATDTQSTARKSLSAPVHKRPYDSLRSENQYQIRRVVVPRAVVQARDQLGRSLARAAAATTHASQMPSAARRPWPVAGRSPLYGKTREHQA